MSFLKYLFSSPLKPDKLQSGDLIGVAAPSGCLDDEGLNRLDRGIRVLQEMGFAVKEGRRVRDRKRYLAGTDADRAADLNDMLRDPRVKAVLCARGGFGVARILERIDYRAVRRRPKAIVGFSDLTALQAALYRRTRLVTFSGLMVAADLADAPAESLEVWRKMLCDDTGGMVLASASFQTIIGGKAEGILFGGCLSILCSLLDTPFMPDLHGAILIVEDIGEPLYRVDRCLTQLKLSGILKKLHGVVFGEFVDAQRRTAFEQQALAEVVTEHFAEEGIPAFCGFPYGHFPHRLTLPFGIRAEINTDKGTVTLLESATR